MTASRKRSHPGLSRQATLLANIFEGAQAAILPLESLRWHSAAGEHRDAWKQHSSQALTIDVFGTIKVSPEREAVLGRIAAEFGLPAGGPWEVQLEWKDPEDRLGEKQPTWVDAVAQSPRALIFFECKFTESAVRNTRRTSVRNCLPAWCCASFQDGLPGPDGDNARLPRVAAHAGAGASPA